MATKGYSFQDDEKTIIDIYIDMDIAVEKEKNGRMRKMYLYLFYEIIFFEKFEIWMKFKCFRRW